MGDEVVINVVFVSFMLILIEGSGYVKVLFLRRLLEFLKLIRGCLKISVILGRKF